MDLPKIPKELVYWIRDSSGAGSAVVSIDAGLNSVLQSSVISSVLGVDPSTVYPFTAVLGVVFLFSATYAYGSDI